MKIDKGDFTSNITIEDFSSEEYQNFLKIKLFPTYKINKNVFTVNTKLLSTMGLDKDEPPNFKNFNPKLFDYEKFVVELALLKRRFAIFMDTGLGKTFCFLEWVRFVKDLIPRNLKILIVSPLMVITQTIKEQEKFYGKIDIDNVYNVGLEDWIDSESKIGIINYDKFKTPIDFKGRVGAIVLDESSILKDFTSVIRTNVINASKGIGYKLACSATPAPNDREEYANHAYFLDQVRSYQEFFSRFFINRDDGWIIKPHAVEAFYKYLSSFSIFLRNPKNYGFKDNLKGLKPPIFHELPVEVTKEQSQAVYNMNKNVGLGLIEKVNGITSRNKYSQISRGFLYSENGTKRIESNKPDMILDIVRKHPKEKIIIFTNFEEEGTILKEKLDGTRKLDIISGSTNYEKRMEIIENFKNGGVDILLSKPRLLGFGLNLQACSVVIYAGINDSFEQFYQSLRRVYRYGNEKQINVYIPVTRWEKVILENVMRKQRIFEYDSNYQEGLYKTNILERMKMLVKEGKNYMDKIEKRSPAIVTENYTLINGDNIMEMRKLKENSIDFSIFSPPFASLFSYSSDVADMGNCGDMDDEFILNYKFFALRLFWIMKPGRKVCVHVSQLPILKSKTGYIGMKDFRGLVIQAMQESGFYSKGEVAIKKNQQMQSIVKHAPGLAMHIFKKDSNQCIPCYNDYVLIFEKPGENKTPITPFFNGEMNGDDWIKVAAGCWMESEEKCDIRESDTLNTKAAKSEEDERHVCPLQLELIRRFVKLYSNPHETILDPFSGIGSTGYICGELGRKYIGIELKKEYFVESEKNIRHSYARTDRSLLRI